MDWTWIKFTAAAAMLCYGAGPRLAGAFLILVEVAIGFGASFWLAAATHQPLPAAAGAMHAGHFLVMMLAPSALGIAAGWWIRRVAPPGRWRRALRVTGDR